MHHSLDSGAHESSNIPAVRNAWLTITTHLVYLKPPVEESVILLASYLVDETETRQFANLLSQKLGPAPQPLRFPGFSGQQALQNRNTQLGSGRLQNTKLGSLQGFCARLVDLPLTTILDLKAMGRLGASERL